MKKIRNTFILICCTVIIGIASYANADQITKPYTFSAGQTASSTQVNENFDVLYDEVNSISEQINNVPTGGIIMYSGAWDFDATGLGTGSLNAWVLCNGQNGTPDLTDRFVMGTSSEAEVGETGGANSYSLTVDQLAEHTHIGSTDNKGSHTHAIYKRNLITPEQTSGAYGWQSNGGAAGNTMTPAGDHSHTLNVNSTGSGAPIDNRPSYISLAYIMKL